MQHYFPAEKLKHCPEGFNILPISKVEGEEGKYRVEMSLTPFYDYSTDIIEISHPQFLNKEEVFEVTSFLMLRYERNWLIIEDTKTGVCRLSLQEDVVNRGDEQRVYSYCFSDIRSGLEPGNHIVSTIGFIKDSISHKIIFINRVDFPQMPSFIKRNNSFILVDGKELLSSDFDCSKLSPLSQTVLSCMQEIMDQPGGSQLHSI